MSISLDCITMIIRDLTIGSPTNNKMRWRERIRAADTRIIWTGIKLRKVVEEAEKHNATNVFKMFCQDLQLEWKNVLVLSRSSHTLAVIL